MTNATTYDRIMMQYAANLLTDNQIESRVERAINALDARLMKNELTQEEYDEEVSIVDKWAQQQYDAR